MQISELVDIINGIAPFETACSWDNCGLLAGDGNEEVKGVYLTLDADLYALEKAEQKGCNVVVSHHPIIFGPVRSVTADTALYHYIRKGVAVISIHTCLDMAQGGVGDLFAAACGIENPEPFMLEGKPLAKCGQIPETDADAFIQKVKANLESDKCDCVINRSVQNLLTVCGSGGSAVLDAYRGGFDSLVTGEAKHDHFVQACELGINLFAFGHFETERIVLDSVKKSLEKHVCVHLCDRRRFIERR